MIGTGDLVPTGTATFTTSNLSVGDHPITAHYLGVKDYAESTSAVVSQVVNKAQATLSFDPATLTQTYSGTARVVTVTTSPAALAGVTLTYNGATTAPVNAGSYRASRVA